MSGVHKAKFFCESCGAQVPQNAIMCKSCGKFFSKVRCPACGFTGEQKLFSQGCPKCGYAVNGSHQSRLKQNQKQKTNIKGLYAPPPHTQTNDALPFWVYAVVISLLVGIVFCFFALVLNKAQP